MKKSRYRRKKLIFGMGIVVLFLGICQNSKITSIFAQEKIAVNNKSVIASIGNQEYVYQDFMFYFWDIEEKVSILAAQYDYENPSRYWNSYIAGKTVKSQALELAIQNLIKNEIYSWEAEKNGITLTDQEVSGAKENAKEWNFEIYEYQREITQLEYEDFEEIALKEALSEKYENSLQETYGYTDEEMILSGEVFQKLEEQYQVKLNETVMDQIEIGNITIR